MAISPRQLNEEFMHEVDLFESLLDEILAKKTITKGGRIVTDRPSGLTNDHFRILRTRYTSVGWSDVKWESDQREGDWLSFVY
jgi:hypothetical protein